MQNFLGEKLKDSLNSFANNHLIRLLNFEFYNISDDFEMTNLSDSYQSEDRFGLLLSLQTKYSG